MIEGYDGPKISRLIKPTYNAPRCFEIDKLFVMIRGRHNEGWDRHFGTTNVLFMDGHVSNLVPRDIGAIADIEVGQKEVLLLVVFTAASTAYG